jgi:hypothetical protein
MVLSRRLALPVCRMPHSRRAVAEPVADRPVPRSCADHQRFVKQNGSAHIRRSRCFVCPANEAGVLSEWTWIALIRAADGQHGVGSLRRKVPARPPYRRAFNVAVTTSASEPAFVQTSMTFGVVRQLREAPFESRPPLPSRRRRASEIASTRALRRMQPLAAGEVRAQLDRLYGHAAALDFRSIECDGCLRSKDATPASRR